MAKNINDSKIINLNKIDANGEGDKKAAKKEFEEWRKKLEVLQETLYAEQKQRILIVLQAMDTGGKDGTIRAVFEGVNPQGVKVASFKVPTAEELAHDYLWRIHKQTPGRGEIVIFNRSHYEDVLVVRVHQLVPENVWIKRFEHINQFEQMLADEGTTILKFYLHIDKEEQKQRFLERLENPKKMWKFNPNDIDERKNWDAYMKAYEDVLNKTNSPWAPWHIIPANRNWYRNLTISKILVKTLEDLKMEYPKSIEDPTPFIEKLNTEQ